MKNTLVGVLGAVVGFPAALCAANLTGDGYIYITEPSTVWTPPSNVTGTARFMWYPDKAAFRFGDLETYYAGQWNSANIGSYSFAGGLNATASGERSFSFNGQALAYGAIAMGGVAIGSSAVAIGDYSYVNDSGIALGAYSQAYGSRAVSIGEGTADGYMSVAILGWTDGSGSVAVGTASSYGSGAIAIGGGAYSTGSGAIAIGGAAAGNGAITIGSQSAESYADGAIVIGTCNQNTSISSVALGASPVVKKIDGTGPSNMTGVAGDPVFMVSQGLIGVPQENALTIYRNGISHFNGVVRVKNGGDIPMGDYQAIPSGVSYP